MLQARRENASAVYEKGRDDARGRSRICYLLPHSLELLQEMQWLFQAAAEGFDSVGREE